MRILPKPEKHPTSFLAPLGKPSLHKNADVSGNTRLTLPHHLRYPPDSQFHRPEQVNNPEPRRVGPSPEDAQYGVHDVEDREGGVEGKGMAGRVVSGGGSTPK